MQSIQAPLFNLTFEVSFLHIEKTRGLGPRGKTARPQAAGHRRPLLDRLAALPVCRRLFHSAGVIGSSRCESQVLTEVLRLGVDKIVTVGPASNHATQQGECSGAHWSQRIGELPTRASVVTTDQRVMWQCLLYGFTSIIRGIPGQVTVRRVDSSSLLRRPATFWSLPPSLYALSCVGTNGSVNWHANPPPGAGYRFSAPP